MAVGVEGRHMDRTDSAFGWDGSRVERGLEFLQAEFEYARWLASQATTVAREDGPVSLASRTPKAIRNFAETVERDYEAIFGDASRPKQTWERKDGKFSPAYYAMAGPNEASDRVLSLVDEYASDDPTVLEIGCSSGRHLSHLHDHGYADLHGVEINEEAIAVMEKAFPDLASAVTLHERPIQEVVGDFEDGQFDVVYTVETLELIPPDDDWVFGELRRVADDLLITVENEGMDQPGTEVHHVEDFPLYLRDWREVMEDGTWEVAETEDLDVDTVRAFRPSG